MRGLVRTGVVALAALVVVCALPVPAGAAIVSTVPEIDGSMLPAALGLATAGVLMLRARRRSK